ncbi:MAG: hypothetical protein AAGF24_12825, partial [Cyanobacteria bacterium P01_H01_bin.121]
MARQALAEAYRAHASAEKAKIPGIEAQREAATAKAIATAAAAAVAALGIGQLFSLIKQVGGVAAKGISLAKGASGKAGAATKFAQRAQSQAAKNAGKLKKTDIRTQVNGERIERWGDRLSWTHELIEDVRGTVGTVQDMASGAISIGEGAWDLAGTALDR